MSLKTLVLYLSQNSLEDGLKSNLFFKHGSTKMKLDSQILSAMVCSKPTCKETDAYSTFV